MDNMSIPGARLPNPKSVVRSHTGTTPRIGLPTGDFPGSRSQHTGNRVQKHTGSKPGMAGGMGQTNMKSKARSVGKAARGAY